MSRASLSVRFNYLFGFFAGIIMVLSLAAFGCGSSEESTEQWETTPTVSPTARLEYRIDSLKNENRRMKEQLDAVAAENRNFVARNAELETKLNEALAAPKISPAPIFPPTGGSSGYSAALASFKKRDFAAAIQQFEDLLKGGIKDDLAGNCHYWIGESYYGMRKYNEAIQHFQMVFDYKQSRKKDAAQLMIGNSYAALGNTAASKEAYEKLIATYPTSRLVKKAQDKVARLK